jgi:hypothetical protein
MLLNKLHISQVVACPFRRRGVAAELFVHQQLELPGL